MNRNQRKTIPQNKSENCHSAVRYTYLFLNLLAVGPLISHQPQRTRRIISIIWILFCLSLFLWEALFRFIHVYYTVVDLDEQIDLYAPIIFLFVIALKFISIIYRHDVIKKFTNHIVDDWNMIENQEEEDIMKKNLEISNNITLVFAVMMYISCAFYNCVVPHLIPFLIEIGSDNRNISKQMIIFPGYNSVLNVDSFPIYQITYICHLLTAFIGYTVLITACHLIVVLVTHVSSQLQIIMYQIDSLLNHFSKERKFAYAKLSFTISRHVRAIKFSNHLLKKVLFEICLIEIGASAILLCIVEFCFLRLLEKKDFANMITYVMIFFSLSLNILILCYYSDLLEAKFMEIGKRLNESNWYDIPIEARQYFNLILVMAQRSQKISAGGVIDLSFMTYLQVLKTGFAYLQILRASEV